MKKSWVTLRRWIITTGWVEILGALILPKESLVEFCIIMNIPVSLIGITTLAAHERVPTVSYTMQKAATNNTWFVFLFGAWLGHMWSPAIPFAITYWPYLLIPIGSLAIMDVVHHHYSKLPQWSRYPLIYLLLGILSGALLWGTRWKI